MNTRTLRLTLLGLALGVLLALVVAPQTRWLVRMQTLPFLLTAASSDRQRQAFVRNHSGDLPVQLGGQSLSSTLSQLAYERRLVPRFPNSASLRANILRHATSEEVHLSRDEGYLLGNTPVPLTHNDPNNLPPTPAALAAFDADAAVGERLDPDNAYFPMMRAVGLFAAHRDTEGLAAMHRASVKHHWQEYWQDEVEGRWRVNDAVCGGREAISSLAVMSATLFPHYAGLRGAARVVAYHAILEEQAGRPEQGLAGREGLARCGRLVGTQSTVIIGNLVGVAISAISRSRPGGGLPLKSSSSESSDQMQQKRLELYCAYVVKIGHPEAAVRAQSDVQDAAQTRRIISQGITDRAFGSRMGEFYTLAAGLAAGWVLVANMISLLLLGSAAAGLARHPQVRANRPLPAGAFIGGVIAVLLGAALTAIYFDAGPTDFPIYALLLAAPPLLLTAFALGFRPRLRRLLVTALLAAAMTLVVIGLFAALGAWQMHGVLDATSGLRQANDLSGSDDSAPSGEQNELALILLGIGFSLLFPLLTAITLSIRSWVKRIPASVGLVLGLRSVMPPLVCVLVLVYGGLTVWAARQESQINRGTERSLQGEGQYVAQLIGQPWPGPVR